MDLTEDDAKRRTTLYGNDPNSGRAYTKDEYMHKMRQLGELTPEEKQLKLLVLSSY